MFYPTHHHIQSNSASNYAASAASRASSKALQTARDVRELQEEVDRLKLLNQAMWEMLQQKLGFSEQDLETLAQEIDLRDGQADGKITAHAVRCPSCNRVSNSKRYKCMYCGQLFEKPTFG